ncbi:GNAT family N-acetyltransferase [Candidatus Leptofilum sp.]|uniref:GNAT family N-acetyltransferase n=1 Tax=Candidatus Leptofilum sp. TaxID=3241576 RepID=UPI003B5A8FA8
MAKKEPDLLCRATTWNIQNILLISCWTFSSGRKSTMNLANARIYAEEEMTRPFWGHSYATEACRALFDFAFSQLDIHRKRRMAVEAFRETPLQNLPD